MIPLLPASSIRPSMRWAADEQRLAEACVAVLGYLRRHSIAASWSVRIWLPPA
jgi:hypothetical protein